MELIEFHEGHSPIIVTAIHDGHDIRENVRPYMQLGECERMREEDPYSDFMTDISDTRIIVHTSRFEVDLNRPRANAVYGKPEDAWGLNVWKQPLPEKLRAESLNIYDTFYEDLREYLFNVLKRYGYFMVMDIHTYNHRRESPQQPSPSLSHPEINVGTASLPPRWKFLSDMFINTLTEQTINNVHPDVRENVIFKGGHFSQWINQTFGDVGCALAIEIKKTFMDEWTGRVNIHHLQEIRKALAVSKQTLTPMIDLTPKDHD